MIASLKRALPWINGLLTYGAWRVGRFFFRVRTAPDRFPGGRVCVMQFNAIGDVLMATPLIQALVDHLGPAQADVLVTEQTAPLLESLPLGKIHRTEGHLRWRDPASIWRFLRLAHRLRAQRYLAILDAARLPQSAWLTFFSGAPWRIGLRFPRRLGPVPMLGWEYLYSHEVDGGSREHMIRQNLRLLQPLGIAPRSERMRFVPSEADRAAAAVWLSDHTRSFQGPYAVIHPGAKWPPKRWHAERFAAIAHRLAAAGVTPVLVGSAAEQALLAAIAAGSPAPIPIAAGALPLRALGALIEGAAVFLGNDSGLSHLATAVGTPAVVVFGPTHPEHTGPLGAEHRTVGQPISCRPCRLYFTRDRCERGHNYCMDLVTVEEVWQAIQEIARARHTGPDGVGGA